MIDKSTARWILKQAQGESTIKDGSHEHNGITIEAGAKFQRHAMGSFSMYRFEIIGFAAPKAWAIFQDRSLDDWEYYTDEEKALPAVILKTNWDQYEIARLDRVAGWVRADQESSGITPLG